MSRLWFVHESCDTFNSFHHSHVERRIANSINCFYFAHLWRIRRNQFAEFAVIISSDDNGIVYISRWNWKRAIATQTRVARFKWLDLFVVLLRQSICDFALTMYRVNVRFVFLFSRRTSCTATQIESIELTIVGRYKNEFFLAIGLDFDS